MQTGPGIYVEILIQAELDKVWRLTQQPELHQQWDLRFTRIDYLPRPDPELPQHFLNETHIGFGLSIKGTGESVGVRAANAGDTTSALRFASDDPKSLIREGSGYWRYVPIDQALRFFTWYDYRVRFGLLGSIIDRLVFRPIMGWATAWSFDRLRLWAEMGQTPEDSMQMALIHAAARLTITFVWIWHGLVPKLIYRHIDEQIMLKNAGISIAVLPWMGGAEVVIGLLFIVWWRSRSVQSPLYLRAAFNPVTLNIGMIALSLIGWMASRSLPSAKMCKRVKEGSARFRSISVRWVPIFLDCIRKSNAAFRLPLKAAWLRSGWV